MIGIFGFSAFDQFNALERVMCNGTNTNSSKTEVITDKYLYKTNFKITCIFKIESVFNINTLTISWSFVAVCKDELLWLCGFKDGTEKAVEVKEIPISSEIIQTSCNRRHVVCVFQDGSCWQYSLESKSWKDLSSLLSVEYSQQNPICIAKVSCGERTTAILSSTGEVYNMLNKLTLPDVKIVDVACGRAHILMLSDKGQVYSTGEGSRGQLGLGELENEEEPCLVEGLAGLLVVAIACGSWHSCAVTVDGDLYSWGWNTNGQLGLPMKGGCNKVSLQASPSVVDFPGHADVRVVKLACGSRHTVVVLDNDTVWGCGWNGYGQLALPVDVDSVDCMTALPTSLVNVQELICGPWSTVLTT